MKPLQHEMFKKKNCLKLRKNLAKILLQKQVKIEHADTCSFLQREKYPEHIIAFTFLIVSQQAKANLTNKIHRSTQKNHVRLPFAKGHIAAQEVTGPKLTYCPRASSMKNKGMPHKNSIHTYGIRNAPPPFSKHK